MPEDHFDPKREIDRCSLCATCTYVCPVFIETRAEGHTARGHMQLIDAFLLDGTGEVGPDGSVAMPGDAAGMGGALGAGMSGAGVYGGAAVPPAFAGMLDCCLRCFRCQEVCPSHIHTVAVFESGRAELTRRRLVPKISDWIMALVLPSRMLIHLFAGMGAIAQSLLAVVWKPRKVAPPSARKDGAPHAFKTPDAVKSQHDFKSPNDDAFWFVGGIAIPRFAQRFFIGSSYAHARAPRREHAMIAAAGAGGTLTGSSLESIRDRIVKGSRELRVGYLVDCMTDTLYPSVAQATVDVLESAGVKVIIPEDAGCCGAPLLGTGELDAFARMAHRTRDLFLSLGCDYIIASNPTCAKTMKYVYAERLGRDFAEFGAKVRMDFEVMRMVGDRLRLDRRGDEVGWHDPCHQRYALGIHVEPRELLAKSAAYTPRDGEDLCCGFGGTFCVDFPSLAQNLAGKRGAHLDLAPEDEVATTCPACLYYLNQYAAARGAHHRSVHLSEVVRRALK